MASGINSKKKLIVLIFGFAFNTKNYEEYQYHYAGCINLSQHSSITSTSVTIERMPCQNNNVFENLLSSSFSMSSTLFLRELRSWSQSAINLRLVAFLFIKL